jgi:aminoglycoside phosphotransferase (APT) family kinase protein
MKVTTMENVIVAPEVRELGGLAKQLGAWLQAKVPEARELRIENLAYPHGAGRSHETILFDVSWLAADQRVANQWVVRIKPGRHTVFPDDLFEQQYKVMRVVHEHGAVRVAKPLWLESDPSVVGAPFFIMERSRGRVAVSIPPYTQTGWVAEATPAQRAKMWRNGVQQLAAVQSVPLSSVQFLQGPANAREGLEQEWDKYVRFADWVNQDGSWNVLGKALERLRACWPANRPPGLVWGDARIGNMMFNESFEVVAVMDWEQPSLGGALHDLAWWLYLSNQMHGATAGRTHFEGFGTREETIALWQELTGICAADIEWYEDFAAFKVSCTGLRLASLRGTPFYDQAYLAKRLKVA